MDGTHLNIIADTIDDLADDVEEFTTTASEKAAQVAQRIRDAVSELRAMAATAGDDEA